MNREFLFSMEDLAEMAVDKVQNTTGIEKLHWWTEPDETGYGTIGIRVCEGEKAEE